MVCGLARACSLWACLLLRCNGRFILTLMVKVCINFSGALGRCIKNNGSTLFFFKTQLRMKCKFKSLAQREDREDGPFRRKNWNFHYCNAQCTSTPTFRKGDIDICTPRITQCEDLEEFSASHSILTFDRRKFIKMTSWAVAGTATCLLPGRQAKANPALSVIVILIGLYQFILQAFDKHGNNTTQNKTHRK